MRTVLRRVDRQGRIVIPASWRKRHAQSGAVLLIYRGDRLEILSPEVIDLTAYFDAVEADLQANLADWHGVRRNLRKRKGTGGHRIVP